MPFMGLCARKGVSSSSLKESTPVVVPSTDRCQYLYLVDDFHVRNLRLRTSDSKLRGQVIDFLIENYQRPLSLDTFGRVRVSPYDKISTLSPVTPLGSLVLVLHLLK